ncbi:polysaccharide biosynthesis protein [Candidatus Woesearchaeota archaeon]|nr:polysaccharide biosynthesis protein [Candidatus Woesearchaeota archaeon]
MNGIKLKDKVIGNNYPPFIIGDIGSNHNGDINLAKIMIDKARDSGLDAVKFQTFDTGLFSSFCYEDHPRQNEILKLDPTLRKHFSETHTELKKEVKKYTFTQKQATEIKKYCKKKKIIYFTTPIYKESVDFNSDILNCELIKIASMDLNNYPFIEYIAKKNKIIILSTGMSTYNEVKKAIKTIKDTGNNKIILLHCISIYPPEDSIINLRNILKLQELFPEIPVGFSDHTFGYEIPLAAVALGACVVEKHFTLHKDLPGWDHRISADPDDMKKIVKGSKRIYEALGKKERIVHDIELEKRKIFRRSLVATKNLRKGHIITNQDLDFKRPGIGIPPEDYKKIIGKELKKDIEYDELFSWTDF